MDKRKDRRFDKKLYVKINSGALISWGQLCDISENGLFIRSNRGFTIGTVMDIEIFMPDNSIALLKGIVRRIIDLPESDRKFGIGVELMEKDMTYKHLLKLLNGQGKTGVPTLSGICDRQGVFKLFFF